MSQWDAAALRAVPVDRGELAETIAVALGLRSVFGIVETVQLHLDTLDSALTLQVPELLADQMRWRQARLRSAGIDLDVDELDVAVIDALTPYLDAWDLALVQDVHNTAGVLVDAAIVADSIIELPDGPARRYLQCALSSDRDGAVAVVHEAMVSGLEVAEIMLSILQPAQVELGRLWEIGEISIAHEHYTTAITQMSLSLLYPRLMANRPVLGRSLVATTVGSESHVIGIRMISDLLEQAGWRTTFLGADLPDEQILDLVAQTRADVLALSATMSGHVAHVRRLIQLLRADPRCHGVKVLVGGRPFTINPALAELVGADGWAADARDALAVCAGWAGEAAQETEETA